VDEITAGRQCMEDSLAIARRLGRPERALRIAGAADAQLRALGHQFSVAFWTALLDRYLGEARSALGGAHADTPWQAGQRLSFEAAVAETLESSSDATQG
jgi:hypothetical protein